MKMPVKYKILLVVFLLLQGCVTQKKCLQKFPPSLTRDSSFVQTIALKPVFVPGFSNNIVVPVRDCPDQLLADFENSKLKQQVRILNGKLISYTLIKPDTIKVPVVETIIKIKEIKVLEPVRYIPPFYKKCMYFTIFVVAGAILFAGWKIRKFFW